MVLLEGITKDHFERYPYSESDKKSAYHQRLIDIFRLSQVLQKKKKKKKSLTRRVFHDDDNR